MTVPSIIPLPIGRGMMFCEQTGDYWNKMSDKEKIYYVKCEFFMKSNGVLLLQPKAYFVF